jgi:hypothetical protein
MYFKPLLNPYYPLITPLLHPNYILICTLGGQEKVVRRQDDPKGQKREKRGFEFLFSE